MITICRIVRYTVSADDAEKINRRRTTGASIAERMKLHLDQFPELAAWPAGAQAHIGNPVSAGQVFPATVVSVCDAPMELVNLQVFLDGNDVYWATSIKPDQAKEPLPGTWAWPARE